MTYKVVCNGSEVGSGLSLEQACELRDQLKTLNPNWLVTLMLDR